jgi:ribulose kinase
MATVKNNSKGPRGIRNALGDLVMIEAGQSATGDFPASEVKDFKAALAYEAGEQPEAAEEDEASNEKPLAKMNKAELIETAKAENVEVADDATNAQLVEAIEKARAAKE